MASNEDLIALQLVVQPSAIRALSIELDLSSLARLKCHVLDLTSLGVMPHRDSSDDFALGHLKRAKELLTTRIAKYGRCKDLTCCLITEVQLN